MRKIDRGDFGRRLQALRIAKGLSTRQLADLVGVTSVTMWKWERGQTEPRRHLMPSLAKALQVTVPDLLDPSPPEPGEPAAPAPARAQPLPGRDERTFEAVEKAKQMVADAAGTRAHNVKIVITF